MSTPSDPNKQEPDSLQAAGSAPSWISEVAEELIAICMEEAREGEQSLPFRRAMRAREILQAHGVKCIWEPNNDYTNSSSHK